MSNYEHTVTNLAAEQGAKLVRDKIPAIILAEDGRTARVEVLDDAAYEQALCKKAIEEATEFAAADADSHVLEEAADVLEVIYARLGLRGLSLDDVEKVRVQKNEARGSFSKRLFMYPEDAS